jgi:hypothetical protein
MGGNNGGMVKAAELRLRAIQEVRRLCQLESLPGGRRHPAIAGNADTAAASSNFRPGCLTIINLENIPPAGRGPGARLKGFHVGSRCSQP